tara:strand:+ start:450 stop:743 length:294 start_codon:yes stop_codon:yes gene_type:complete
MKNPIADLVNWQLRTSQLDHWTSYHLAAGAFFCKIFQWLDWTDFWCVMGVFIIGVLWEIFEWIIEGDEETYGTKKAWAYNTMADIVVETGIAWWMVL